MGTIFNRASYISTKRDAWVEVNLDYIERNIIALEKFTHPDSKILAVVKADAYGHGAVMISPTLMASGVDMLGVSSVDEAMQLREAKIDTPVLVLGAAPLWAFDVAALNKIALSVFTVEHIEAARQAFEKTRIPIDAHIKVDTGMNRIGIAAECASDFIKAVADEASLNLCGVFTHFANAEVEDLTKTQYERFKNVLNNIETKGLLIHCCNTSASVAFDSIDYNMARLGVGIYGLYPDFIDDVAEKPELKQVVSVKARITNIHNIDAGEGISYGYSYFAEKSTKIATIPIGYADGVSRRLSNKMRGIVNGQFVKQVGNITMDQMMFDVSGVDVKNGDIITILGESGDKFISVDEWANLLGTINYELTCLLKVRLSRVYTR